MRLNRMVDQRQRLRDLMSEVQENHTEIQRLWKAIEAGGVVWPVGIAADPPIEEMSSSSSQSSSSDESSSSIEADCGNCVTASLPSEMSATLTSTGDANWDGTFTLNYFSTPPYAGVPSGWYSDCFLLPDPFFASIDSVIYEFTYGFIIFSCSAGTSQIRLICGTTDCTLVGGLWYFERVIVNSSGTFDCDPFYWNFTNGTGYTAEITE